MNRKLFFAACAFACLTMGCTKMSPAQMALDLANSGQIAKSGRPECEIQIAEYGLDTKLVSFELTDSGGLHAGFDLVSGFLKLLSLDFKASAGSMTTAMSLFEPISPKYELLNQTGAGTFVSFAAGVDAGFQNIGAGFSLSHQTPLADLARQSLDDTFGKLYEKMNQLQQPWHTSVVAVPTKNQVVVHVGSYANLKVGDQFSIYNVEHVWSGTPCSSDHLIARKTTSSPIARAQVTQIANNAAVLTVVCGNEGDCVPKEPIEVGATVEVASLGDADRQLYRLLEIRNVIGATIPYVDSKTVDVEPYLKDEIRSITQNYGFMIYSP